MKKVSPYKHDNWFGKPYYFFGDYLWDKYKNRVLKLPINAGLICPNRNGTISSRGCIFCCEDGSASPISASKDNIIEQMESAKKNFKRSDAETRYIAYFQAYTNTYADTETLMELYNKAISVDNVMGLMIGTRPDCLNEEILDLIASYKKENFELWLEIGMQSSHNKSLQFLNRGHSHEATQKAVSMANERGIPVCVHIILGIPDETWEDMMATAFDINEMNVNGVKLHHLHVIKGTELESLYSKNKMETLSLNEYVSTLCDFIERLKQNIIIHRLAGDREENTLIAPAWGLHKGTVQKAIEDEFRKRGTYQGFIHPI